MSKELKVGEVAKITLKFKVEEAKEGCAGCWGADDYDYFKCDFLRSKLNDCGQTRRKDKTNIIYKLIEEKEGKE